ncbi:MAG: alpha/beta hydrolase [Anaerolineales bacterium]|nr:alpha/beta hydrolase [Chloroflexota bacterium]MBL6980497.1 alpha/beta hydrolase [Anaerolineales bacterium]
MSIQAVIASLVMRMQMADFYKDPSIEVQRAKMTKYARAVKLPADVKREQVDAGGTPAEWIITPEINQDGVILYLHGGAYYLNYDNPHRDLVARLGRQAQMRSLILEYRLAPENPFPAALDDAVGAYHWLVDQGYSPNKISISGDSCGGGLALATALKLRDEGVSLPAGIACISPWTDLTGSGDSMASKDKADFINSAANMNVTAKYYAGEHDLKTPYISPLYANLDGLPPLLIQVGTREVLLDDSTRLAERARQAGVDVTLEIWNGMFHVFHLGAAIIPEAQKAVENMAAFLRRCVDNNSKLTADKHR